MNIEKLENSQFADQVVKLVKLADSMRKDKEAPMDVSLADLFKDHTTDEKNPEGLSFGHLLDDMGIDPSYDTISNLMTVPTGTDAPRWVVPEIVRSSIKLGLRKAPIFPNVIAGTQRLGALKAIIPSVNLSDAAPRWVAEGETITFGSISYGSKEFKIRKMGRGISLTDEVKDYVSLDVVRIFLEDFGVKLGYALDALAVDVLINGEQADGSESAPVIGVENPGTLAYRDLLKIWVRLSRLGRAANTMIAGEDMAIDILDLDEFKKRSQGTTDAKLNVKTPIPNEANLFIHGSIPAEQVVILDPKTSMLKFDSKPLMVETERIVSNQTEATYVSLSTGFATVFKDSRLVLDSAESFDSFGFPAYMNVDVLEVEDIK